MAGVPLTNMFRDKTFEETELPIMVNGYTYVLEEKPNYERNKE